MEDRQSDVRALEVRALRRQRGDARRAMTNKRKELDQAVLGKTATSLEIRSLLLELVDRQERVLNLQEEIEHRAQTEEGPWC